MSRADRSFAQALERIENAGYLVNVRRCGGAVELCAVPLSGPAKLHIAFAEPRGPEDGYSAACRLAELLNVSLESPVTVAPQKRTGPKDASVRCNPVPMPAIASMSAASTRTRPPAAAAERRLRPTSGLQAPSSS